MGKRIGHEMREKLGLPDVSQIGVVVRDLNKTIEYYENVLGLGPFVRPEFLFTATFYYGKPVDSLWMMGFCSLGPVELEIIQHVTGPTIYKDFLKERTEGIHHLGFDVDDMNEKLALCQKMGIQIIQNGWGATSRFAYLDTVKIGGVVFELIERKSRRA